MISNYNLFYISEEWFKTYQASAMFLISEIDKYQLHYRCIIVHINNLYNYIQLNTNVINILLVQPVWNYFGWPERKYSQSIVQLPLNSCSSPYSPMEEPDELVQSVVG
ncbi:Hypothetical_protein [Hexamita inflata]|uniref:Hypothetical_protein n=1 Tax=Hexamita inflata TaxID=28002 RepID=A0AA86PHK0_9EUKA|nr:Hypothetical protein HINF_LOCUS23647 [Hexamita inflata]CAI9936005.1 Hypothetical protein HINF_LOCUS23650 [Hexamita inflata]